ncbi:hypothetical protein HHI36_018808 [Cryptolaemus montrouzieri]|uniref:Phospholipid/glycerol acyltransferase domain-containing protein n=1 Tax=Cryptolaemus montrouzieri TaxID=559131 RepID=A0ABD2P173_9CUCU
MGYLVGILYCFLWYTSILAGYSCLYCPILPVLLVSNKLYRYWTDIIFTFWQAYPTVLLHLLCNCEIEVTGDAIRSGEMSILIMNHRTRTDWNFLWPALFHSTGGISKFQHSTKFLLKDAIRHVPGPGWVMQLTSSIFIKRCWHMDKIIFEKFCYYVSMISYKCSILIFPEGTDFTEETKKKSDSYAIKNNLQKYEYLLHPRTRGFAFIASKLLEKNCLDAIYDLTLIYPDIIPQNEKLLLEGNFPKQVKIHIVRYPTSVLSKSQEELSRFLEDRWMEKKNPQKYYTTQNFLPGPKLRKGSNFLLLFAFIFWTLLPSLTIFLLIFNSIFRQILFIHTILLIIVSFFTPGFQYVEVFMYDIKKYFLEPGKLDR